MAERTTFPLREAQAARRLMQRAARISDTGPDGWSISQDDPSAIVTATDCLWLKDGYVLRAYQYRAGDNGNGIIWAMPADEPLPAPDECPRQDDGLQCPRPPEALEHYMEAIDGDGTPWSYLCASLVGRQLYEFGAIWHGCWWDDHDIVGPGPVATGDGKSDLDDLTAACSSPEWTWLEDKPTEWRPAVDMDNEKVVVTFYTYSGLEVEAVYRHVDTYVQGSYRHEPDSARIATGGGGYIH